MGWGAVGLTCRLLLCAWVPGTGPGHMVAEQVSLRLDANQYHTLPCASGGPWPCHPSLYAHR